MNELDLLLGIIFGWLSMLVVCIIFAAKLWQLHEDDKAVIQDLMNRFMARDFSDYSAGVKRMNMSGASAFVQHEDKDPEHDVYLKLRDGAGYDKDGLPCS